MSSSDNYDFTNSPYCFSSPPPQWSICTRSHSTNYPRQFQFCHDSYIFDNGSGEQIVNGCSRWLMVVKCKCKFSWYACKACNWRSEVNGIGKVGKAITKKKQIFQRISEHALSSEHISTVGKHEASGVLTEQVASLMFDNFEMNPNSDDYDEVFSLDNDSGTNSVLTSLRDDDTGSINPSSCEVNNPLCNKLQLATISERSISSAFDSIEDLQLRAYIAAEYQRNGNGSRQIATISQRFNHRGGCQLPSGAELATTEGSHYMFAYASVYKSLPVSQRRLLLLLVNTPHDPNIFGPVEPLNDVVTADRVLLNGENSIIKSMPIPSMHLVDSPIEDEGEQPLQHVCVDPCQLLHFLFAELPTNDLEQCDVVNADASDHEQTSTTDPTELVESYFGSSHYKKQLKDLQSALSTYNNAAVGGSKVSSTIALPFKLWSDAWDPDSTKQNRNSIWCMVITFMVGKDGPQFSFPIAIGPKAANHHTAIRYAMERLEPANKRPFEIFHRDLGQVLYVSLVMSNFQVDRLERAELFGAHHHASHRGKCFGVIRSFPQSFHDKYPACSDCLEGLIRILSRDFVYGDGQTQTLQPCTRCACYNPTHSALSFAVPDRLKALKCDASFSTLEDSPLGEGKYNIIVGDPSEAPVERKVGTEATTYDSIFSSGLFFIRACQFITYQCWKGKVTTKADFAAYLEACNIQSDIIDILFESATRHRNNDTTDFREVFNSTLVPPAWYEPIMNINNFLDAPMHLLFLGVTQAAIDILEAWLSKYQIKSSCAKFVSERCTEIGDMSLGWIKLLKWGSKVYTRGSWVSEQYVGLSKYVVIPYIGLVFSTKAPHFEVQAALRTLDSLSVMLSLVMQRSVCRASIDRASLAIKIYLSAMDDLVAIVKRHGISTSKKKGSKNGKKGKASGQKRKNPTTLQRVEQDSDADRPAVSSDLLPITAQEDSTDGCVNSPPEVSTYLYSLDHPNHASLPPIIRRMRSHGPPVDQWDGGDGCEKAVQLLKPYFHGVCTVSGSAMTAALSSFYRSDMLSRLTERLGSESTLVNNTTKQKRERYTLFKRYALVEDVETILQDGQAELSCVLYPYLELRDENRPTVLCVHIRGKHGSNSDTLYELNVEGVRPFGFNNGNGEEEDSNDCAAGVEYVSDLLYFGNFTVGSKLDRKTLGKASSNVLLIPGRHVWRDERHSRLAALNTDSMYTIVTSDYGRLNKDGKVVQYNVLSSSLWEKTLERPEPDSLQLLLSKYESMTKKELQEELSNRKLQISGNKGVLIARLKDNDNTLAASSI